jgi:RimJ/RimL family protein N-acetyltransferase
VHAFLTEFVATESTTSNWLSTSVAEDGSKILFMVDDDLGRPFGYMGLAYIDWASAYGEADAVVRGRKTQPGAMKLALLTLLEWARGQLGLRELGVRVLSDNPAIEFYQRAGFVEVRRVPLAQCLDGGHVRWVEDEQNAAGFAARHLVHMRWRQDLEDHQFSAESRWCR